MSKLLIIVGLIMMSIGVTRIANAQEQKVQIKRAEECVGVYWIKHSVNNKINYQPVVCLQAEACAGLTLTTNSTGSKSTHQQPKDEVSCVKPGTLLFVNSSDRLEPLETEAENYL